MIVSVRVSTRKVLFDVYLGEIDLAGWKPKIDSRPRYRNNEAVAKIYKVTWKRVEVKFGVFHPVLDK